MDELTGVLAVTELADAVTGLADAVTDLDAVLIEGVLTDGFTENIVAGSVLYIPGDERDAEPELIFAVLRVDICI